VEPTEAQYLIINALDTLELLTHNFYDQTTGIWYIATVSPILPVSQILPGGDITPVGPESEL
jgi:hypothetical protein